MSSRQLQEMKGEQGMKEGVYAGLVLFQHAALACGKILHVCQAVDLIRSIHHALFPLPQSVGLFVI